MKIVTHVECCTVVKRFFCSFQGVHLGAHSRVPEGFCETSVDTTVGDERRAVSQTVWLLKDF